MLHKKAITSIKNDLNKGDVYIISASLDLWLIDIANYLGVALICTKAAFKNDIYTGDFLTLNCNYDEKLNRAQKEINLSQYSYITYYGDSKGDLPMKKIANKFYYKPF